LFGAALAGFRVESIADVPGDLHIGVGPAVIVGDGLHQDLDGDVGAVAVSMHGHQRQRGEVSLFGV
jgi:hypothetical protein